jgi:hypothetical protein
MPRPHLQSSLSEHQTFRHRLLNEYPDLDDETLLDTLEGMTDLHEQLATVVRSQLDDTALKEGLKRRLNDMQARLARIDKRIGSKRALVTSAMDQAGIKKVEEPDFTVSVRQTPPTLSVGDETEIPKGFWKPQPAKLDRSGLIAALKNGSEVPGAALGNGGVTISVRTR